MTPTAADCSVCARLRSALRALVWHRAWNEVTPIELADAAGVPARTVPQHYRSVVACGVAAFEEAALECRSVCEQTVSAGGRDCVEQFLRVAEAVLTWTATRQEMARFLFVVPERTFEPALLTRLSAVKGSIAALFDRPGLATPAGLTHVEFVVGLVFQVVARELAAEAGYGALRREVIALAPFVETASGR